MLRKYGWTILGIFMGSICSYLYYYYVGCSTGTSAITSSPFNSTLYGAVLGGLLLNIFNTKENEQTK